MSAPLPSNELSPGAVELKAVNGEAAAVFVFPAQNQPSTEQNISPSTPAENGKANETGKDVENGGTAKIEELEPTPPSDITFFKLFSIFFWFGCNAFGGPVVQIA
jgi:hypothetical protein